MILPKVTVLEDMSPNTGEVYRKSMTNHLSQVGVLSLQGPAQGRGG